MLLALITALTACGVAGSLPPITEPPPLAYRLDSGDEIRLIVLESQPLSGDYSVSDAGTISVPLLGALPVRGLTVPELERTIAAQLKESYFENPNVSAEIKAFRPFFILGSVSRPGEYAYRPGMTVLTAVAIAGGFSQRARTDIVSIVRRINDEAPMEGVAERSTPVMPGDTIYVFERIF